MDMSFLGYLITGLGVIITFYISVSQIADRFTKPLHELKMVMQKLTDAIEVIKEDGATQARRLERHSEQIDKLDGRVGRLEVKMEIYHGDTNNDK